MKGHGGGYVALLNMATHYVTQSWLSIDAVPRRPNSIGNVFRSSLSIGLLPCIPKPSLGKVPIATFSN